MSIGDDWDYNVYAKRAEPLARLDDDAWEAFVSMTEMLNTSSDKNKNHMAFAALKFASKAPQEVVVQLYDALDKGTSFSKVVQYAMLMRETYEAGVATGMMKTIGNEETLEAEKA